MTPTPEQIAAANAIVDDATNVVAEFQKRHGDDAMRGLFGAVLGYIVGEFGHSYALGLLKVSVEKVVTGKIGPRTLKDIN